MSKQVVIRPGVDKLHSFPRELPDLPVEEIKQQLGLDRIIKLSFNESPYGHSPMIGKALQKAMEDVHLYPSSYADKLCEAIANDFSLLTNQVLIGNGADEVINLVVQAFVAPEEQVVVPVPTFGAYAAATNMVGGEVVRIPLKGWHVDLEAMKAAITDKTKMIFICNPNNPTSTLLPYQQLADFLASVPPHIIVVVDEAYNEYTDDPAGNSLVPLISSYKKLLVIRTFSKIYGLAALRVGYLMGNQELIEIVQRVRPPFNVNALAQAAALAAWQDKAHIQNVRQQNALQREAVSQQLKKLGMNCATSQTNFLLVDTGADVQPLYQHLLSQGIVVRPGNHFGMPNCLRISLGSQDENQLLLSEIEAFGQRK